jgi:hypothetical protein
MSLSKSKCSYLNNCLHFFKVHCSIDKALICLSVEEVDAAVHAGHEAFVEVDNNAPICRLS